MISDKWLVISDKRAALCTFGCMFLFLLGLSGCERREITYYMETELTILADWNESGLADAEHKYGATAVFFPREGGEPKTVLMGDRTAQKVRLTEGVYDVVLFNRSFDDFGAVSFTGNGFGDFRATARKVETRVNPETRATTRVIVQTPEEVAADTYAGFEVTEAMLGNYSTDAAARMRTRSDGDTRAEETDPEKYILRFTPRKHTRRVNVKLHVTGLNNVSYAVGTVDGVSECVTLCNGALSAETVTQQFALTEITFENGSPFDGVMTGAFNVFGLDCSEMRTVSFTFHLTDGKTVVSHNFETEITQLGDGALEYNITLTPPKIPDVKPTDGEDAGFDVDVEGWGDPEDVEIPMENE